MCRTRWGALALAGLACGRSGYDVVERAGEDAAAAIDGTPAADATVFSTGDGVEDTYLSESEPDRNFGGLDVLRTAANPAMTVLVRFDVTAIEAGATVNAASLTLWTSDAAQDATEVRIYRVFEAWVEGSDFGDTGEASWELRAPGLAWFAPGCGAGSRDAAAKASMNIAGAAARYQVDLPASIVQEWVNDAASNRGLALIATAGSGVEIESTEASDPERRPALVVEWSP